MSSGEELPGPAIDVGDDPIGRRAILPRWIKAVAALALMGVALAILVAAILFSRVNHLSQSRDTRQGHDTEVALYAIAYRICARESVDRAYAHWRDPQGTKNLPLLDCSPNLRGQAARLLTPPESGRFVDDFVHGRLSLADQGICPRPVRIGQRTTCR